MESLNFQQIQERYNIYVNSLSKYKDSFYQIQNNMTNCQNTLIEMVKTYNNLSVEALNLRNTITNKINQNQQAINNISQNQNQNLKMSTECLSYMSINENVCKQEFGNGWQLAKKPDGQNRLSKGGCGIFPERDKSLLDPEFDKDCPGTYKCSFSTFAPICTYNNATDLITENTNLNNMLTNLVDPPNPKLFCNICNQNVVMSSLSDLGTTNYYCNNTLANQIKVTETFENTTYNNGCNQNLNIFSSISLIVVIIIIFFVLYNRFYMKNH